MHDQGFEPNCWKFILPTFPVERLAILGSVLGDAHRSFAYFPVANSQYPFEQTASIS